MGKTRNLYPSTLGDISQSDQFHSPWAEKLKKMLLKNPISHLHLEKSQVLDLSTFTVDDGGVEFCACVFIVLCFVFGFVFRTALILVFLSITCYRMLISPLSSQNLLS